MPKTNEPDWIETPDEIYYVLTMNDPGGETIQDVDLTRAEFIALKKHLAELRGHTNSVHEFPPVHVVYAPGAEPATTVMSTESTDRWNTLKAQAEQLLDNTQLFDGLEIPLDVMAVLALIDLLKYGDHDGSESAWSPENAANWLGCFLIDILLHVAREGPKGANGNPEYFVARVDEVLKNLREAIEISRRFSARLPADILERLDKVSTAT